MKEKNIGPTDKDFQEADKELNYLINLTSEDEESWLRGEFYHKAGNLEFYNYFYPEREALFLQYLCEIFPYN